MNATIATLLCAPLLVTGLAAQRATQEINQPKVSSRRLVDVSIEGLGETSRRTPGEPGGSIGFSARRPTSSALPLDCLESIADQATGGCLTASSTATLGMLYPYPGLNNVFVPQAFVGGGEGNQATERWSTVGGGRNNIASGYLIATFSGYATVGGGRSNQATGITSTVGGGSSNTASGGDSTVAGGFSNIASGHGATVSGGGGLGFVPLPNVASGNYSTVGGGKGNQAIQGGATVGGGRGNTASAYYATIGGGRYNTASGGNATVAGGGYNTASGNRATVGGGVLNDASGRYATVPGGSNNTAMGDFSFAAGRQATASHTGSFVWGDSFKPAFPNPSVKTSSVADEFNVYCSSGARFFSNSAAITGVLLAPGGGSWSAVSDRDSKENVEPVDGRAVLERLASLPLSTWNYKAQDDSIRHMGPMAQDFHAAFGLGVSDKLIDTIDPDGVALAAIQGLNELVQEKDAEIEELRAANEELWQSDKELRGRVERLEALTQAALAE